MCFDTIYQILTSYVPSLSVSLFYFILISACYPWYKATPTDESFVKYCREPSEFLTRVLPLSSEANAILRRVFVSEDHRPDVTAFIGTVDATEVWYNADVVFEGSMARWRELKDCVESDGWVHSGRTRQQGLESLSTRLHDGSGNSRDHGSPNIPVLRCRRSPFTSEELTAFDQGVSHCK